MTTIIESTVESTPTDTDLTTVRGDTKKFSVYAKDSDSQAFDLTGYTMTFTAKSLTSLTDSEAEIQVDATISSVSSGIGAFTLSPTNTAVAIASYFYDIQISDGSANVYTLVDGTFTVTQDVTLDV